MNKQTLRKIFLDKRRRLTESEYEWRCTAIAENFINQVNWKDHSCIHTFLPIIKHREINTFQIIEKLRSENWSGKFVTGVSDFKYNTMKTYLLEESTTLKQNHWGIPEPVDSIEICDSEIDMVITPLVVADKTGHRIGYGKGFYDIFFKKLNPRTKKVGLSLSLPLDPLEYFNSFDMNLDILVTPYNIYNFNS
ncbi:5-formyltetrahydrofolate cyclo-ligase [Marinigracilibium pacificum]|uniref:5-formyltetrahydrofolate cyclo-ligase n=1 Tax=Marinigracilibium pacificum TaxID=2729599 RepID=A0A848IY48_9BACT|nr:5-formyltetrahydrofolate cyclo-ligase [Marinigracilibium pacificum]NMM46909.1 5-formyltetrahydrofolate cyclo-ligase [Marinigracilibium pacificum]